MNSLCAVRVLRLFFDTHSSKSVDRSIRNKDRIISEPLCAIWFRNESSIASSFN